MQAPPSLLARIDRLYNGDSLAAHRFSYALILFDAVMIAFIVGSSFVVHTPLVEALDAVFGVVVLADFAARMAISRNRIKDLSTPVGIADVIVIASLLAPIAGEGLAFLRVARALRLFRSYRLISRLRKDVPFFRRNQDTVQAALNLFVFIFIMTALVYETQHYSNPAIGNYVDALYFTVTTLTTTGFGDITLQTNSGRLLAVLIMIFGVSLFIRLIQVVFRPARLLWRCRECGLTRHDTDAIHCKHCGAMLNVPHEGEA
jgi:voltage-gated potassium channel